MTTIPSPSALRRLVGQLAATILAALLGAAPALAADPLQAFPPAEAGMVRHVIQLPRQDEESAFKVELIVGKTVRTDPANRYFFAGKV